MNVIIAFLLFIVTSQSVDVTDKYILDRLSAIGVDSEMQEYGVTFIAPAVTFDSGKYSISDDAENTIIQIVKLIEELDKRLIYFEGHTDSVGTEELNLELGRKRAQAVKDIFVKAGATGQRIIVESQGENVPISTNNAENRRVEIVFLNNTGFKELVRKYEKSKR